MSQNRRDFLKLTSAGVAAWGLNVPAFLSRAAAFAPDSDSACPTFYATDSVEKFQRLGSHFLGRPLAQVHLLDLGG